MMQMFFQVFFVTAGKPTLGLVLTITGGVTNVILDYLFMGPMGMGVIGAALATGIGQTIMAVVGIVYAASQRYSHTMFLLGLPYLPLPSP